MTFWRLLDERGSNGFAAADLHLHLGEDWKTAPVQKARRMAEFIDDPLNPASALTVLEERSGKIFVTSESHPLRAREVGADEVELWVPDWRKISEQLSSTLGFFPCEPRGEGTTRQIGNIHSRKLASRPVFLHIPKGGNADCMSPLNEMATMPASVLFLLSQKRITPAIHALAHERGIMLDSVIERLAAPDSASIPIRTRHSARSHKSTTASNLIEPILDVQTDWRWQKLKITIDPTGRTPLHTASSASLIHSRKPIKPTHAATLRSSQRWPFTGHGNHPENTPKPTRGRSSPFNPKLPRKRIDGGFLESWRRWPAQYLSVRDPARRKQRIRDMKGRAKDGL